MWRSTISQQRSLSAVVEERIEVGKVRQSANVRGRDRGESWGRVSESG